MMPRSMALCQCMTPRGDFQACENLQTYDNDLEMPGLRTRQYRRSGMFLCHRF